MAGEGVVAAAVVVVAADSGLDEGDLRESSLGRLYLPAPACLLKSNREKNARRCFGGRK